LISVITLLTGGVEVGVLVGVGVSVLVGVGVSVLVRVGVGVGVSVGLANGCGVLATTCPPETVMLEVATIPLTVLAVIIAVPGDLAVTLPRIVISTTLLLLEDQMIE